MNGKRYIVAGLLLAIATTGYSAESAKVPEHVTLETVRELVARNEALINPIKMTYTNKKSRKGERQSSTGGSRIGSGRRYSHSNCIWAQDGEKHFARVDYFYGPNEPANSTAYVFDTKVTTRGKLPELMEGEISRHDHFDWYNVMVAKLGLRPFEGEHRLSEILVPEYASLRDKIEILNDRGTYVVDAKRPTSPHYFARIWVDKQRGMPLHINYYRKHPTWDDARLMGEISDIELYQLQNGAWFPVKGLRSLNFSNDDISYEHISVDINSITIQREDIPESLFDINFPMGAKVYNAITGITTIVARTLLGKSLPKFEGMDITFTGEQIEGKQLLICFFDMEQRPSRNCILELARQIERLNEKDMAIIAVHASRIEQSKLDEWIKENDIAFPVGMIEADEEQTRPNWGVKSLPWLILTDTEHVVRAEGFALAELDEQIKEAGQRKQ